MAAHQVPILKRKWQDIASQLSREEDSEKMLALCHELNDAMLEEQRLKVQQRIGLTPTKQT